jgi:hypothetical protein
VTVAPRLSWVPGHPTYPLLDDEYDGLGGVGACCAADDDDVAAVRAVLAVVAVPCSPAFIEARLTNSDAIRDEIRPPPPPPPCCLGRFINSLSLSSISFVEATRGSDPEDVGLAFEEWELAPLPDAHAAFRGMHEAEECDGASTAEALEAILER